MRNHIFINIVLLLTLLSCKNDVEKKPIISEESINKEIHFYTSDSIKIYGDFYKQSNLAPTILLLHQGGSNAKAEYKNIAPQLQKEGFNTLAIDLRVGSNHFYGDTNRTVNTLNSIQYNYCDAYPDIVAALDYLKSSDITGEIIVLGSSYSGSLAIKLANENQNDIDGVLAFSPPSGGPMKGCNPEIYFESLKKPLLLLRPFSEMQSRKSQNQFERAKSFGHKTYIAKNGAHGASMLDKNRVEGDIDENWQVVLDFLNQFK